MKTKRIVVLISGSGSNLQALIDQVHQDPQVPADIVAVISNRPDAYGLERAKTAAIPAQVLDHKTFPSREAFDSALQALIDTYAPDYVILAGFMRILTADFVSHYHGRMINIHPSLLPDYKGTHTHERVLADGKAEHGASVHFVTAELDGGPVIMQVKIPVLPSDTPELLAARLLTQEHRVYPEVVKQLVNDRIVLGAQGIEVEGRLLTQPLLLANG
ncbi:phosphoribosylglycinamide formyltransferase [Thiofilum flexile]|uniref:phosphoribosylglycinamide formyltransferase n=1 Tax=Thiofilum flexile TaxID=125627 RepID=UPI000368F645